MGFGYGRSPCSEAVRLSRSWRNLVLLVLWLPSTKTSIPFLINRYLVVRLLNVSNGANSGAAFERNRTVTTKSEIDPIST